MADPFINVGVNADNLNNGFQQAARNIINYSQTINSTINNVNIDMSRMYTQVNEYNNQVITQFNQVNTALVDMRNNAVITNNSLTNVLARQEQQINNQNQVIQRTATITGQIVQGIMTRIGASLVDMVSKIASSGIQASKVYEDMSAKLSSLTGDIESAKDKFWELNALEDKTAISTDKLTQAYLTLGNNGLNRTTKQLEKYAAIAQGTNKDITGLAQNISNFVNGRLQSLKEYGITAEKNGNKIVMSFKGERKEIEATSEALEEYLGQLADTQFGGVLEARTNTLTASFERLQNAWGTLTTRIMDGSNGAGQVIRVFVDNATEFINRFADALTDPIFSQFFDDLTDDFRELTDFIKEELNLWRRWITDTWTNSTIATETGIENISDLFSQFFSFMRIALMELTRQAQNAISAVTSIGDGYGRWWHQLFNGSDSEREYKAGKDRIEALFKQRLAKLKKGTKEYEEEIARHNQAVVDWEHKYSDKQTTFFGRFMPWNWTEPYREAFRNAADEIDENNRLWDNAIDLQSADIKARIDKLNELRDKDLQDPSKVSNKEGGSTRTIGGTTSGTKGGSPKKATDTWTSYYNQLVKSQQSGLSELEKAYADYYSKIDEITKRASESSVVDLKQVAEAKLIVEQELQKKINQIKQDAQAFIWDLTDNELAKLQDSYQKKLDMLNQYHEQAMISEESYAEAVKALYDKYYAEQIKKSDKNKNKNSFFSDDELENLNNFRDGMDSLSDAFSNLSNGMNETSSSYRAMFAMEKAFAVASATINCIVAWSKALSGAKNWYEALANYASAIATTSAIMSQLKSVTMHDKGGSIPAGKIGIVGEYGPELISGPASVTSRKNTAELARSAINGSNVVVNLYEDRERAGQVDQNSVDGQQVINIFVSNIRKGGGIAQTLESTYQLRRYGA